MQINLTGFLNAKQSRQFMGELWTLLLQAQSAEDGIPTALVEMKKEELQKKQVRTNIEHSPSVSGSNHYHLIRQRRRKNRYGR